MSINSKLLTLPAVLAVSLALGVTVAPAGRTDPPSHRSGNQCVNFDGVSFNILYGSTDQFIARGCLEATAGEHWIRPDFWSVAATNYLYPAGYVPSRPTPMEDFLSKLTIKVVVDGGTAQEKTRLFTSQEAVRTDVTTFQAFPGGVAFPTDTPMASILPRMAPLGVGQHTTEQIWILSARHCDGLSTDVDACLAAGENLGPRRTFTVSPPAQ